MLSLSHSATESATSILVIDDSYHYIHRLKRILFTAASNLRISGYNTSYKGYPGKDFNWENYDILMLDARVGQHKSFGVLKNNTHRKKLPYTVILTGSHNLCDADEKDVPGMSECLLKSDITSDTVSAIINRATQSRPIPDGDELSTPLATPTDHKTVLKNNIYDFQLPFSDVDIANGDAHINGYKIERLIGVGGMSAAYLAVRLKDRKQVVIKTLKPAVLSDDRIIDRFIMEYQLAKDINHPNIIKIYDQRFTDNFAFIVMQYLPGASLKSVTRYVMSPRTAARYALDITSALMGLHEAGIVHRDLKPSNFHFNQDNQLVLLDFGISKKTHEDHDLTRVGEAIGTPHFMSPEQVLENPVDERSDLYALGIILYKMLTGKFPFRTTSALSMMYQHVNDIPPRLPFRLHGLEDIVGTLLEKKPDDRYQTAALVHKDLVKFLVTSNKHNNGTYHLGQEPVY